MIGYKNYLYVIGAGHVSLAFSRIMQLLDFHVSIFDDRENLNTFEQNNFVHHKKIIDYENIIEEIGKQENQYVVIMTFGYRTDGLVIRKLINKKYKYLGLLGSKTKVAKIVKELRLEDVDELYILVINGEQVNKCTKLISMIAYVRSLDWANVDWKIIPYKTNN